MLKRAEVDGKDDEKKRHKNWRKHHERSRRQAATPPVDTSVVGKRFSVSCEKKGIATDGSGMLMLCSRCWAWRELPANYYPRYMNELICDDVDNSCLSGMHQQKTWRSGDHIYFSGYAKCGVSHKSAYVVRNDTGVVNVVTLQAGSFCECRVQTGTALETLVTGAVGTPLPSLPTIPQDSQLPQSQPQETVPSDTGNNNAQINSHPSLFWY